MPRYQQNFTQVEFEDCAKRNPTWPRLYAEGDSWFALPPLGLGGNVLYKLAHRKRYCLVHRAANGDTAEAMLGKRKRERLLKDLAKADRDWRWQFDAILFSAGGNDIVGDTLMLVLNDWKPGMTAQEAVRQAPFQGKLAIIRQAYEDFIAIRDELQPGVPILLHEYDRPYPDGRAAVNLGPILKAGPWLQPSLDARGIPRSRQRAVISVLLNEFKQLVRSLEREDVFVVPTQGLLNSPSLWGDELHPTSKGFKLVAERYRKKLEEVLGR